MHPIGGIVSRRTLLDAGDWMPTVWHRSASSLWAIADGTKIWYDVVWADYEVVSMKFRA